MIVVTRLVWADEFDGPATRWRPELGGGGWGDDQLQHYTAANAVRADGRLAIEARREADGTITSARLRTLGRLHVRYGRVEARIRVPAGAGLWPAFWMLGTDIDEVGWPACGEIDVMEHVGSEPLVAYGTAHGPGYAGIGRGAGGRLVCGEPLADDFHVFAVEWAEDLITWHLDDVEYFRLGPAGVPGPWPFRHPFYLLLNLAVGGSWPGNELTGEVLPATMLVDWVRVVRR